MKKMLAAVITMVSLNAFAGYSAKVCQTTEGGIEFNCRVVYFDRDLGVTPAPDYTTCSGEAQDTVCDKPGAHVPAILIRINNWFKSKGFKPANPGNTDYIGG